MGYWYSDQYTHTFSYLTPCLMIWLLYVLYKYIYYIYVLYIARRVFIKHQRYIPVYSHGHLLLPCCVQAQSLPIPFVVLVLISQLTYRYSVKNDVVLGLQIDYELGRHLSFAHTHTENQPQHQAKKNNSNLQFFGMIDLLCFLESYLSFTDRVQK